MGDLRVTIEHGSSGPSPKILVIGGGLVLLTASGGVSAVTSGLMDLLWWLFAVMAAVIIVVSVIVVRKIRATRHHGYVESIHGPSERNRLIDLEHEKRSELARIKAIRHDIERERVIRAAFSDDTPDKDVIGRIWSTPLAPGDESPE